MATIRMFTKSNCSYCRRARLLLERLGADFVEIVVDDPAERAQVQARYNWPTVPVILLEGQMIGGSDELQALHARGLLESMLGLDGASI